jgi:hypothetical protein
MDAWIKIFIVLVMLSALSLVVGYMIHDPFVGLILLAVILTLLVVTVEPATGKAMAQVTIPIVIILFVFQIVLNPGDGTGDDPYRHHFVCIPDRFEPIFRF